LPIRLKYDKISLILAGGRMKQAVTKDEKFILMVSRINRYLIILGIFLLIYFLLKTKVDMFLFLLSLLNMVFALLSHKHLELTNRLAVELQRSRIAMKDITEDIREMHPDK
jgi:hypothetical protein